MKVATAVVAAVTMLGAAVATDIESGFTQDGATTYCMGANATATLNFDSLVASNVGRCPVGLTMTLTGSQFHANDVVTVKWSAKTNAGLSNAIFPNAIDASGLPGAVTVSNMWACTVGTNCATNVAGTPTGADGTSTGAFNADGTKTLETNTFNIAAPGDYIVVGIVALPGDASLFITSEEYLVFKKISIVSADTPISSTSGSGSNGSNQGTTAPPTSAPPSASASDSASDAGNSLDDSTKLGSSSTDSSSDSNSDGTNESSLQEKSGTASTPTASADQTDQTDTGSSDSAETASTSNSGSSFFSGTGAILIAVLVACCIVGVVGFAFVMRRRKDQRMAASKAFDLTSPSMASEMDERALNGDPGTGKKIDLTYVANISARNNDKNVQPNMSDESSVAIMASAERGSELNSSNGSSLSSNPDVYAEKVSYGAAGAAGQSEANSEDYRISNMSELSSIASGSQSDASMSNFGDSIVSARQNKYLQTEDWKNSEYSRGSSHMESRLDSMEQAELKARGFGSIGGFSTVSGYSDGAYSENNTRITGLSGVASSHGGGFSMSSRPTQESYIDDFGERETQDSRFTEDYRPTEESRQTEDSRVTEDSRATGFSEAMSASRLQSEVSVDSYSFRPSRSSVDSYSSGVSGYSRDSSRISGLSVDSNLDSSKGSNY